MLVDDEFELVFAAGEAALILVLTVLDGAGIPAQPVRT
jgi:hypothetical protein